MPVPSSIDDLSQTANSNSPPGSENPNTADDYLRTYAAYIATLRDGKGHSDEVQVASAATADIGAANSLFVEITGTTTITSFGTTYNGPRFVRFSGALTLTHNASSLILPGGANITTVAGDACIVIPNAASPSGWRVVNYQRLDIAPQPQAARKNLLINGGMEINQRGLTSVADDAYCLDRWYVLTETGNVTVAQQTDQENGTPYNIRLTQPDVSAKQIALAQIIQASESKALRGRTATLSARIRNSTGGQVNYAVLEWTGTADTVTSDVISAWASSPTYIGSITERAKGSITPSSNTWTDAPGLAAAISGSTNNIIVLIWSDADMAQNATLDISRVQLEAGPLASGFERLPIASVLSLCQRRRQTISGFSGICVNATTVQVGIVFPVEMAATPSASATAAIQVTDTASAYTQSAASASIAGGNSRGARVQLANFSGMTTFRPVIDNFAGSIVLDAEL